MITFTRTRQTHDPETEALTETTTTITGEGIIVQGDAERYRALGLVLGTQPTILFTPSSYNLRAFTAEFVLAGDVTAINGENYSVIDVAPVAPDGFVIVARIIVGK